MRLQVTIERRGERRRWAQEVAATVIDTMNKVHDLEELASTGNGPESLDIDIGNKLVYIEIAHPDDDVRAAAGRAHHLLSRYIARLAVNMGAEATSDMTEYAAAPIEMDDVESSLTELADRVRDTSSERKRRWSRKVRNPRSLG